MHATRTSQRPCSMISASTKPMFPPVFLLHNIEERGSCTRQLMVAHAQPFANTNTKAHRKVDTEPVTAFICYGHLNVGMCIAQSVVPHQSCPYPLTTTPE